MNADAFRHFYGYHFSENRAMWDVYIMKLSHEQFMEVGKDWTTVIGRAWVEQKQIKEVMLFLHAANGYYIQQERPTKKRI